MSEASEEILKFVLLIEQHTDVLLKSQTISNKKKKEEAADLIISKWQTKLTKASLFKKISNLKTRAKSALKNGKRVNEWHTKILGIVVRFSILCNIYRTIFLIKNIFEE